MDQRPPDETPSSRKLQNLSPARARQAVSLGRMRYVLGIGLALVIIAFAIIWFLNFHF